MNIELNDFLASFNEWMNNQNLSPRANLKPCWGNKIVFIRIILIHIWRLSSWKCGFRICLCIGLYLCHYRCHLGMTDNGLLILTMYNMWVAMLKFNNVAIHWWLAFSEKEEETKKPWLGRYLIGPTTTVDLHVQIFGILFSF